MAKSRSRKQTEPTPSPDPAVAGDDALAGGDALDTALTLDSEIVREQIREQARERGEAAMVPIDARPVEVIEEDEAGVDPLDDVETGQFGMVDPDDAPLPYAPTERLEFIEGAGAKPEPGGAPSGVAEARAVVANLLFASPDPVSLQRLSGMTGGLTLECVRNLVADVSESLAPIGLQVSEVANGWQLATSPAYSEWVFKLARRRPRPPLSPAALEALAIVAYKQPITRSEIDTIRGIESGEVLRHLVEIDLLEIAGRKEVPGRPLLYATTRNFLKTFGLARVADLPPVKELKRLFSERERQRQSDEAKSAAEQRRAEREAALERMARPRGGELEAGAPVDPEERDALLEARADDRAELAEATTSENVLEEDGTDTLDSEEREGV